jgi:pimeloyl-ACP methyl ester carboxylesterase
LAALAESRVPTTLIWGELDPVAVPAVADYVWNEVLARRPAPAAYWRVPCGNHYVQNDRPAEVLAIVRGEALPAQPDSQCSAAYLFRSNDGRP